jgi:hypothetical protein
LYGLFVFPILFLLWRIGFVKFAINRRDPPVVFKIQSVQKWSLHAIRAPQDEATIAINTAQFISFVSEFLFVRALLVPFDWIRLRLTPVSRTKRILLWLVVSVLSFPITQVFTRELIPALVIGVIAAPILIAEAIAILVTYITLLGAVILIPANVVLAVALGADLMRDQGLMMIECEPIPSGIIGTVATIRISEDERNQLGLVHFIHATYAARQRAAEILGGTSFGG